ncbi:NADH-quinone oxidoreductase subunit NuoG [Marinobacter halodurans]|uniref:NADH-quinone oxidoreductase n=1 Tax=Marinobacter halodurans TaxID=2528979 RepID=A0ABY1ZMB1_9GAMM|nr:NADH-quinone oxidoreductase subunit NuoG [Marinobacter halodurans]TBW54412.1 NADH-quinone oxidoreductase subunit NuoG [Marinobacter halodurans]
MATIHVDGRSYSVDGADNLLHACLSLGLDIPYFCWHPAMGSVGACRQCAVKQYKDADDDKGMLVMSCMAPVQDDARISIDDEEAREFRASVVEWLMINHPHDCPVCEEGGHCHLQDMTVMTGHDRRRYRFRKRTHRNQYLGPFIAHEMNRCITCYRCVRFYNDYAGGSDLGAFGANYNVYFGRYQEGTLENEFSGNLTEVCPTGVFTDQTHSDRYTRKWDLQFAPGICHQCAVGCNISPGERYGEIRRIENRYHGEVNRYFLCDRGRFGYGYVNRKDRPIEPEWRGEPEADAVALDVNAALDRGSDALRDAYRIIGIGSPRASLESNHQLRELVGEGNFSTGIAAEEQACLELMAELNRTCGLPTPSLWDVEKHDAILVLGEDLIQSAARLGLSVRQAVLGRQGALAEDRGIPVWNAEAVKTLAQDRGYPLFLAYPVATGLDGIAEDSLRLAPDDIARLGHAVAHRIDASAPDVPEPDDRLVRAAERIASALMAAERPLVVSGGSLNSTAILNAAGNIARALSRRARQGGLTLVRREANSTGLQLLGGQTLEWALEQLEAGQADALVVLENDLYQRLPGLCVRHALARARTLIVLDHQRTPTLEQATLALPAASFAEADGTLVSLEGRAQRFFQVYDPGYIRPETRIRESWRWLHALAAGLRREKVADVTLDLVTRDCARRYPVLAGMVAAAPGADYRVQGVKLAREPHRYSGRTSMRANISVSEPRTSQDPDTPFAFSMEGYNGFDRPRQSVAFAWAPGWNSPQAWNKFTDEVGGHLRAGDPGVRLLEPSPGDWVYSSHIPPAYRRPAGEWCIVVLPRLFGGEETSARAEPIQARAGQAVAVLGPEDAAALKISEGGHVRVIAGEGSWILPVRVEAGCPAGLLCIPEGVDPALLGGMSVSLAVSGDQPLDGPGVAGEVHP